MSFGVGLENIGLLKNIRDLKCILVDFYMNEMNVKVVESFLVFVFF